MASLTKLESAKNALLDIVGMTQAELAESEFPTMSLIRAVCDRANEALNVIEADGGPDRGERGFVCKLHHWHTMDNLNCPDEEEFERRKK